MGSELFQKLVKTRRLPTPSATALQILELADRADASVAHVADAVSADPAISARLLKFANSTELAGSKEITTIRQAVVRMGMRAVKVTALSFSLMSEREARKCPGFDAQLFWAHSLATACSARALIPAGAKVTPDEGFTAGILSRLGRLVFATGVAEQYEALIKTAGSMWAVGTDAEKAAFGTDHAEIGGTLLESWKVPPLLTEAIKHQYQPDRLAHEPKAHYLTQIIQAAAELANHVCGLTPLAADFADRLPRGCLTWQTPGERDSWLASLSNTFRKTAENLSISLKDLPDVSEITTRATDLIAELSLSTEVENLAIQAENKVLEKQATTDPLTGCHNRAAFDRQLALEINRAERYKRAMALVMIDVDHFKRLNDTHGHLTGDGVLKQVAAVCQRTARNVDFVARYGGEEFVVIAPETDLSQSAVLAERLRAAIASAPYKNGDETLSVTASFGVAAITGQGPTVSSTELIKLADMALYDAKQTGRNRVCFGKPAAPSADSTACCAVAGSTQ